MRKAVVAAAAVMMILAMVGGGFSQAVSEGEAPQVQERAPRQQKRIKTTEPVKRFLGEVTGIDLEAGTVNVRGRKGEAMFDLSSARVCRGVRMEDLKPGDRIGVVFIERDGKKIAKAIGRPAVRSKRSKVTESEKGQQKLAPSPIDK